MEAGTGFKTKLTMKVVRAHPSFWQRVWDWLTGRG